MTNMNVKALRENLFMTQIEFGTAIGVHVETVRAWETGRFSPSLKNKRKIVEFCKKNNISVRY